MLMPICNAQSFKKWKLRVDDQRGQESIYFTNNTDSKVTVILEITHLNNTRIVSPALLPLIVRPGTKDTLLCTFYQIANEMSWEYRYKSIVFAGDYRYAYFDPNVKYTLPFDTSDCFRVSNIYFEGSHKDKRAIDFSMPVNTSIRAIREGVVVDKYEMSNKGCKRVRCAKMANYVLVQHDDYSIAEYYHLKKDGVIVNVGDKVSRGQKLGYSGNTGYSRGPHLHISVYLPTVDGKKYLDLNFEYTPDDKIIHGSLLSVGDTLCVNP
jgi:hypothetical protein